MTRRLIQSALILSLFALSLQAQSSRSTTRDTLLKAVSDGPGFSAATAPTPYDESTVEKLDPAVASPLKVYGLKGVTVQEWAATGGKVRTTLYEMQDSGGAYGFYTLQRAVPGGAPTPGLIGADSFRRDGVLFFWQANYAVRIEGAVDTQNELARLLSRNILGRSRKPTVSGYLPPANIVGGTERYFLNPEGLSSAPGVDSAQLGFDSSAEAATAAYRVNGIEAKLLLVLYPTQHIAKRYTDALAGGSPAFRKRAGPLFAMIYGTDDEASASAILDKVSHEFTVTWDEQKPGLGLGPIIITVATFVGIVLAFTTVLGLGYGGLRIFMKSRYPGGPFDKTAGPGMIQLKLIQGVTERQPDDRK